MSDAPAGIDGEVLLHFRWLNDQALPAVLEDDEFDEDDFIVRMASDSEGPEGYILKHFIADRMEAAYVTAAFAWGHYNTRHGWAAGFGFRINHLKTLIDEATMTKRNQFDMAGDCLAHAFRYWPNASEGERTGLRQQMMEELKLSASLFDELDAAIPAPPAKGTDALPATHYFRGYLNRLYARGKKRENKKKPLLAIDENARERCYKRAAATIRQFNDAIMGQDGKTDKARWANPVLLVVADELETLKGRNQ